MADPEETGAGASPCLGPPPVLNIYHAAVSNLTATQQKKTLLLKKKIRMEHARLAKLKEAKSKELNNHQQQQENAQQSQQQIQLTSPLTGFEVHWTDDPQNLVRPALNVETADEEASIKLLVYTLERACQSQNRHRGVSATGLCFLMNYNGYSNANQPSLGTALRFIQIFQCIYAEQLAAAYIVDTPWYFTTFWNCISPFLPTRTAAKIKFLSTGNPEDVQQIFNAIHPRYVETWIPGGQATAKYDHDAYWAEEAKQFETYMKFLQREFFTKTMAQRLAENAAFGAAIGQGKSVEEAVKIAQSVTPDKRPSGLFVCSLTTETQEGEEEEAEESEEPETPESLEDEQKRVMLQEALKKQQASSAGSPSAVTMEATTPA
ncbi:uncharacterized protein LOC34624015 [Cyclospora cayetanensis]|uniref:Uncharacterized protein LOC34624015 n=1 Tax=Cyclospora cayetanensis TaxID=88456 RepID=A0A6P6RVA1_9EIME|nr:uncharacterized protein LOC34624015 [Cyclospora cayetanensis]